MLPKEREMEVLEAYDLTKSYRSAAQLCGVDHHTVARVVQYELAALEGDDRAHVAATRRAIESLVEAEVRRGVAAGELAVDDPHGVTRAVLSLCIDVARWYDPAGRESPDGRVSCPPAGTPPRPAAPPVGARP